MLVESMVVFCGIVIVYYGKVGFGGVDGFGIEKLQILFLVVFILLCVGLVMGYVCRKIVQWCVEVEVQVGGIVFFCSEQVVKVGNFVG